VWVKWPNDLLIGERKVGGILIEAAQDWAIAGIGINLVGAANEFVMTHRDRSTALDLEGVHTAPDELLDLLVEEVAGLLPHNEPLSLTANLVEEWAQRDAVAGRRIVWLADGRESEGVALGLAPDGGLRTRRHDGEIVKITAGEVRVIDAEQTG
jgi:BirA family biotin operon repressor/biotin-[acetyl-CoA-carboxylase] ligase